MTEKQYKDIIKENKWRRQVMFEPYDPLTGIGSPIERGEVIFTALGQEYKWRLPVDMIRDHKPLINAISSLGSLEAVLKKYNTDPDPELVETFLHEIIEIRFDYDFEFWAFYCVKIQDKKSKQIIPFRLNKPQRKYLSRVEKMRRACMPIRAIIDKARQWGGSTLTQIYMGWIQIRLRKNWHSAIVTQVENQARNIRGMFTRLSKEYPIEHGAIVLLPFEGSAKNRVIENRGSIIGIGSAEEPDNLRSFDFAMVHLSEVSFWPSTPTKSSADLIRSIRSQIPDVELSLEVLESTANGVGNFFHNEWLAAVQGRSGYEPIFVGWHEIEIYQRDFYGHNSIKNFVEWMLKDDYAMFLWNQGATLEGINWYFWYKKNKNYDDWQMKSEYPTTAEESFQTSGRRVFPKPYVDKARKTCKPPVFIGDVRGKAQKGKEAFEDLEFFQNDKGDLFVWEMPDNTMQVSNRYAVTVDIGGKTKDADYSIIKVFDRYWMSEGGKPTVVATWRGHCFTPETQIYTSEGLKNIEDVKVGDLVWTHRNRFKRVLKTYKNEYDGDLYNLRAKGNYETVRCTPEHPFFSNELVNKVVKRTWNNKGGRKQPFMYPRKEFIGEPKWIASKDLKHIAYSREKQDVCEPPFIINKYNGGKSKNTLREIIDLESFFSVLGYYLAEGHINKRSDNNKTPSSICFSFSYSEKDTIAKDCYSKIVKLGFKASIIEYKKVGVCRVRAYDTNLACLILNLCGEHSWNKKISPEVLKYSKKLLSILLDCYWKGDGSIYKTDNTLTHTVSTVSATLARQIRDILILIGFRPGIYRVIAKTKGKGIKSSRIRYNVVWVMSTPKNNSLLQDDKNIVYKLKSKSTSHYTGYVYNLEVEDDNSYSTACYVVHNCDQDLVCWKSAQLSKLYNNALLVVEYNSLRKDNINSEGDHHLTMLNEIVKFYSNIYARTDHEKVREGVPIKYGWHTNVSTKPMVIDELNGALREGSYYERDLRACDEMDTYEIKPDGSYGAVDGCKDDLVITTAIGVWICFKYMPMPKIVTAVKPKLSKKIVSAASI